MNWDAIGAIGELIGAAGVIATLGYLAFQIRQNTRQIAQHELASRAAAANASAQALRDSRRSVYENSEVTDIWLKGISNSDSLSESERYRFRLMITNGIDGLWDVHSQTTVTGLSPEIWKSQGIAIVERVIASPGGRRIWALVRDSYTEEFRAEVDRILSSMPADT